MAYVDEKIKGLLQQYMEGTASAQEYRELIELLKVAYDSPAVEEVLLQQVQASAYHPAEEQVDWTAMLGGILSQEEIQEEEPQVKPAIVRSIGWRWAAAAVLLLVLGSGAYFYFNAQKGQELARVNTPVVQDIAPGSTKAILTLADGRQVILDSTTGNVTTDHGITVINVAGQLRYKDSLNGQASVVSYHTVTTPRGGQYQLILEDGTRVWLNAASSLRYPTAFTGSDRVVEVTGEAYFEVAHDPSRPFHVKQGQADITVLGTHFNVNAYEDEEALKVTLLEGSVKFAAPSARQLSNSIILKPGEQGQLQTTNYKLQTVHVEDLDAIVAWKNGYFSFRDADLSTIMRQVARWYNVDVRFEKGVPAVQFSGEIGRGLTLKQFLGILEQTRIHYRIEKDQLIITP